MSPDQSQSSEEERRAALDELLELGDLNIKLQFQEETLGGIKSDGFSEEGGVVDVEKLKEDTKKKLGEVKQKCFDLGITPEDITDAVKDHQVKK